MKLSAGSAVATGILAGPGALNPGTARLLPGAAIALAEVGLPGFVGIGRLRAGAVTLPSPPGPAALRPGRSLLRAGTVTGTAAPRVAAVLQDDRVQVTPGSRVVSGQNTQFLARGVAPGWHITFADRSDRAYPIAAVLGPNALTLAFPYQGEAPASLAYTLGPGEWPLMAPVPWHRAGSIDVAAGSYSVLGHGTGWLGVIEGGDMLVIDHQVYEIASVTEDEALTLADPFPGPDRTGIAYAIIRLVTNTTAAALAYRLTQILHAYGVRDAEFRAWVGGVPGGGPNHDGRYPLTDSGGVVHQVPCPALWSQGGIGTMPGVEVSLDGLVVTGAARPKLDFRGAVAVLDEPAFQRARVTVDTRSGLETIVDLGTPAVTALTTAVCRPQTRPGAANLAIDGEDAQDLAVDWTRFGRAHKVTITSDGDLSGLMFTVTGADPDGAAVTETLAGPNAGTVAGVVVFRAITQVAVSGPVPVEVSVGRAATTTLTLDAAAAPAYALQLPNQDTTIRLIGAPATGRTREMLLYLRQPSTARLATWIAGNGRALLWDNAASAPGAGAANRLSVWQFRWPAGAPSVVTASRQLIEWNGLPLAVPSNVTFDPNAKHGDVALSDANRTAAGTKINLNFYGTRLTNPCTQKAYCEFYFSQNATNRSIGLARSTWNFNGFVGSAADSWGYRHDGKLYTNNTQQAAQYPAFAINDVIMVAFDPDGGNLWFGKNGTWNGDPATGIGPAFTGILGASGTLYFAVAVAYLAFIQLFADTGSWQFSPPAGFGPVQ